MVFSKSIAFDEEELGNVAIGAKSSVDSQNAETEFLERLRSGDSIAFNALVNRYAPDIYGLLCRIMKDPEEASDTMQETFLRAFKAISRFRGDSSIKTWLFRIAINQSRNRFRWWKRRKKEKTVSLDASIGTTEMTIGDVVKSECSNPEEDLLRKERERILIHAISELPDVYKMAVVLCDIQGFTYEEIGVVLEINLGTVKSRISRGREELRKKLVDI
jgi:RNA polymerase sigma-70 factor (ECF subfamily)